MKKLLMLSILTMPFVLTAKKSIEWDIRNLYFKAVKNDIPIYKEDVKQGSNVYTIGVLNPKEIKDGFIVFDEPVIVHSNFYTFNTQRKINEKLIPNNEFNIKFENEVYFDEGSAINIRANIEENIADFIEFKNIKSKDSKILINVKDFSINPRFIKLPLFSVPHETKIDFVLSKKIKVSGVEYVLKNEIIENNRVYFLEPIYLTEEQALQFAIYEKENTNNKLDLINNTPKIILLREKITINKDDNLIFTNNILDIFTR